MNKDRKTPFQWACGIFGFCVLGLFVLGLTTLLFSRWDSKVNRGHEYGYYGELNTVSNALVALPGVTIIGSGYNRDVFLEEFGFSVRAGSRQELEVWFHEDDPIRSMSGERLKSALKNRIEEEASNQALHGTRGDARP